MDKFLYGCIYLSAAIAVSVLLMIICYVTVRGIGSVSLEFLTTVTSARKGTVGIAGNIVNTLYIIVITLVIATPIGVGSAIYLNEYAKPGKIVRIIEFTTETLSGIPSIIFGLFGSVFFGTTLKLGYSLLTGALTLSLMILPLITRNTQEALRTVPDSYRSGALGMGATKWHMIRDSGDRTYRRRIGSPALYGRKRLSAPESGGMAFQDPAAGRNFDDPAVS